MCTIKSRAFSRILGFVCILLLFTSCSMHGEFFGRYGRITPNGEVTGLFESYIVNSNLNYYISGADSCPNAIMGIDKGYILVSDLWKKREFTTDKLKRLVKNTQSRAWDCGLMMHGFDILDDRGNDIGDWYSILSVRMPVKMVDENKVIIFTPPLDTYDKLKIERIDRD